MYTYIQTRSTYVATSQSSSLSPPPSSLPCSRPIASTKASSPDSAIYFQYLPLFLRSCKIFLRLLPHLHVTSILPFISPSITRFRRLFLSKMLPIQSAFFRFIVSRILLSCLALCNTSNFFYTICQTYLLLFSPAPYYKTFKIFLTIYVFV